MGLDAQKDMVYRVIGKTRLVGEYIEVESGSKKKRKILEEVIRRCKAEDLGLVVAKLDRLGRIAKHLWDIKDGVELIACDLPNMDTMSFGIFATFAQFEAERIRERTKAAMQVKRNQGYKFGCPRKTTQGAWQAAAKARHENAQERAENKSAYQKAQFLRENGLSYRKIVDKLNAWGEVGPKGGKWHLPGVYRLLNKLYQ